MDITRTSRGIIGHAPLTGPSLLDHHSVKKSFHDVLTAVREESGHGVFDVDFKNEMKKIESAITSGKKLEPQDLLRLQMRAHELNLHVEFISKIADCAVSTVKRFQNNQ